MPDSLKKAILLLQYRDLTNCSQTSKEMAYKVLAWHICSSYTREKAREGS